MWVATSRTAKGKRVPSVRSFSHRAMTAMEWSSDGMKSSRNSNLRRCSGARAEVVEPPHNASREAGLANLKTRQRCESSGWTLSTKSPDVYARMTSLQNASPTRFASETRTTQCPGTLSHSAMAA
jgi:hypothetical protein